MAYDAVCFDLDSTLCESTQDRETVLTTVFDRAGIDPFCSFGDLRALVPTVDTAKTDQEFYQFLFAEAAKRTDGVDPGCAPTLAETYLQEHDPTQVRFRSGARPALESAREHGPVALITNGSRELQSQKLETLGIADQFDVTVFIDPEQGVDPKPSSVPFERALDSLAVDPGSTLHVGDSLHADIAGANAMGMDSAWIDLGTTALDGHRPTYRLDSLEELLPLL